MTIFERLDVFFTYKGFTFNKVSAKTGISPGLLSKGLKKGNASLGSEKITAILEYIPDLSAEWLLREEGPMIKGENIIQEKSINEDCALCVEKDRLVESYQDQIEQLKKDNDWLKNQIDSN